MFALVPGETDKDESFAGIFWCRKARKALGQRTGRMSVDDDNSGSPPLMDDPEIQLRTFVEALFDRPPPSDDDLMRTVLSLKDKSSRLLLSNLFKKVQRGEHVSF